MKYAKPAEIESASMRIIEEELRQRGISLPPAEAPVVRRAIHATADFDYAENLHFSSNAIFRAQASLRGGVSIVTDTNMALSGLSRPAMERLGVKAACFMADPEVALLAREAGTTRAAAAVHHAAELFRRTEGSRSDRENAQKAEAPAFAIGNAPTALFALCEEIENGLRPAFVAAVPVGFVNVTESKEAIVRTCEAFDIPVIAAMGRKGGSTVAAAVMNALLYEAAGTGDPEKRGW